MKPLISVIIPTYNHAEFILETLNSVWSQTFTDFEVIVVNDGSPDNTAHVLRPLISSGRIRYLEQANQGQAAARNVGLSEARGDYIAFLDDDDVWPEEKLEWQICCLSDDRSLGAIAGVANFIDERGTGNSRSEFVSNIDTAVLFSRNPIMSPGQVLVCGELIREINGFDAEIWGADDWNLWFEIAHRRVFRMHDRIALGYRVHPKNATRHARRLFLGSLQVVEKQLSKTPLEERQTKRRVAYNFLYDAWGPSLASSFKSELKKGKLAPALRDLYAIGKLLLGIPAQSNLLRSILFDLAPARLRCR